MAGKSKTSNKKTGKKKVAVESMPIGLVELKECLSQVMISEVVVALLLYEMIIQDNNNFGTESLTMFHERMENVTNGERNEMSEGENERYMLGLLQGLTLAGDMSARDY